MLGACAWLTSLLHKLFGWYVDQTMDKPYDSVHVAVVG